LKAEQQLQRAAAFWVEKVRNATLKASRSEPATLEELVRAPVERRTLSDAEQIESLESALEALKLQREIDVQLMAAFWIDRLKKEQEATASAREEMESFGQDNEQLEEELFALEAEHDAMADRIEVQSETIALSSSRLDDLDEALQAERLKHEIQLQRTAAFWIERSKRTSVLEAELSAARVALQAAEARAEAAENALQARP